MVDPPAPSPWFWPLFVLGIAVCALPFVGTGALPMCDINGSAGIVGALLQRQNPASQIDRYFTFDVHVSPNALYWAATFALSKVMPVGAASNLFLILFGVVGMPVGYWFALRTFGKSEALAFFGLAAVFHRCVWYGFAGSVAAVGFLFFEIGFLNRAFSRRSLSWWDAGLALSLLALATAHAFFFVIGIGIWAVFIALSWHQPAPLPRKLAVAVPALAYLGPWLATTFGRGHGAGPGEMVLHLFSQRRPLVSYVKNVHEWFLNAYASGIDEVIALVFVAFLALALSLGMRSRPPASERVDESGAPPDRLWAARAPVIVVLLGAGYLLLPMSIDRPFPWWALNVRLLVPFILSLGFLVPTRRRGLPAWALVPVFAAAVAYAGFIAVDLHRWWAKVELNGFEEALHAIPPGKRVHAIYPSFDGERHYSHFPMGHIVDWYLVERGGGVTPAMTSHPGELWASPRPWPAAPWGMANAFSWNAHGRHWDYFLVKQPAPGNAGAFVPFAQAPPGAVERVFERGLWSVWRRVE